MLKKVSKIFSKKWLILPALAIVCFILTELANRNNAFVEHFYAQVLYPQLAKILSNFSSFFPFSLDDILYLLLTFIILYLFIRVLLKRLKVQRALFIFINILALVYILFYTFWGFNYFRLPLNERLNIKESEAAEAEFIAVLEDLIDKTNQSHCSFQNFNKTEIDSVIESSYGNLSEALKIKYPMGKRIDKQITFSSFFAKSGITGYFGPFFNEVHVNQNVLPIEYPFILAHEKAHQLGITSEAEANFYAWLAGTKSNSQALQYSANLAVLRHFLVQATSVEEYQNTIKKIDDAVKADFKLQSEHWRKLRNERMDKAASKVNNAYLKSNKIKGGITDYRGVVKHVMNFSLDSTFQQQHDLVNK